MLRRTVREPGDGLHHVLEERFVDAGAGSGLAAHNAVIHQAMLSLVDSRNRHKLR